LIISILAFSSLIRACPGTPSGGAGRSTHDGTVRGEVVTFKAASLSDDSYADDVKKFRIL